MPETKTPQKFPPDVLKVLDKFAQGIDDKGINAPKYRDWNDYEQWVGKGDEEDYLLLQYKKLATLAFEAGQKSGEEKIKSLSESLRVDRLRLEWADKRIKSLEASLKEERLLAQSRANKVEILEAERDGLLQSKKNLAECLKDNSKLEAELKTAKLQGKQELVELALKYIRLTRANPDDIEAWLKSQIKEVDKNAKNKG